MDFIRSHFGKMQLWRVEHFFPPFFSRSVLIGGKFIFTKKSITRFAFQCNFNQSALIWKKTGEKSVQLVRVSFFRNYFLWNPYFSSGQAFEHTRYDCIHSKCSVRNACTSEPSAARGMAAIERTIAERYDSYILLHHAKIRFSENRNVLSSCSQFI